ncbi:MULTISPECIES: hypothetical protein [Halobacterium]|uniref:Cox cluster protein n=6 Tax=Halobacterium salinarum TaxID=2242 RepID=A0A510N555_HALSA|nr:MULTISPECIES: hypothetical protein [Halobacterium]MBB6089995.1 hypothetical protein [Halobacterium salinarum]MCF2207915.1 hypothetical protein [Halobacterium salinarum]MCF2241722.1 hypothetical protein [Halobacterium salinarum]MDL0120711.1 hypothetical protein [Halobacterium salinarum]MDL0121339.1 hypothetical protein [Halobacterium salinarum]
MSDTESSGRRIVLWMYAGAMGTAGVFGYVLGVIVYGNGGAAGPLATGPSPEYGSLGPIVFELTPLNLAVFGVCAVGALLGVGLAAIILVSNRE